MTPQRDPGVACTDWFGQVFSSVLNELLRGHSDVPGDLPQENG